jgi:hypothetical protein
MGGQGRQVWGLSFLKSKSKPNRKSKMSKENPPQKFKFF